MKLSKNAMQWVELAWQISVTITMVMFAVHSCRAGF